MRGSSQQGAGWQEVTSHAVPVLDGARHNAFCPSWHLSKRSPGLGGGQARSGEFPLSPGNPNFEQAPSLSSSGTPDVMTWRARSGRLQCDGHPALLPPESHHQVCSGSRDGHATRHHAPHRRSHLSLPSAIPPGSGLRPGLALAEGQPPGRRQGAERLEGALCPLRAEPAAVAGDPSGQPLCSKGGRPLGQSPSDWTDMSVTPSALSARPLTVLVWRPEQRFPACPGLCRPRPDLTAAEQHRAGRGPG